MSTEVGKLYIKFDADGRPYIQGLKDLDRRTQQFQRDQQSAFDKFGAKLGSAIKLGMAAGAAAVVAGGVLVTRSLVKTAASYEYEMSRIKAVTKATESEMKAMGDAAVKLGADTQFSAGEAAQGMNELAKAGVSVETILGGGIQGTLALAAAGELEVSRAAEVASNAMNVFGLSGDQVIQVADALSAAANKSSLEVEDLALSLQYIGPVASQLGIPMQQVVGALAELGQVGIKGDIAGTGLRGMLNSLISPSSTARDAMAGLGVEIADATGNIKPLGEMLDEFAEGLDGMTEAAKMDALGKIFDTQQLGVAMQLIKGGSKDLGTWTTAVSEKGEAERVAQTKMDNFQGSVEELRGSLETLAIKGGTPLIGWLRDGVDWLTQAANWTGNFLTGLEDLAGWEGADLTGKIKIAWGELEQQFDDWLTGANQKNLNPWSDLGFGQATGEERLRSMGESVGEAVVDVILGLIGQSSGESESPWQRAGEAIASGFWNSFNDLFTWENLRKLLTVGDRADLALPHSYDVGGKTIIMPEIDEEAEDEVRKRLDRLAVESSEDFRDHFIAGTEPIPAGIDENVSHLDAASLGRRGGQGYADGFTAAVQARLNNWQLTAQNFFYAADRANGSKIGGGMTDAELMGLLGISPGGPGDTGGLKPQTSAFWGRLHSAFPFTDLISGYRANDAYPDHPSGTAIDITVPGMNRALADAVTSWAIGTGMVRYAIWNRQTWWPGGGRSTYSHNAEDPHTDHIHIRTYHGGGKVVGQGGPSDVLINAQTGERVLSQEQAALFESLVTGIGDIVDEIRRLVEADTDVAEAMRSGEIFDRILDTFSERMGLSDSYTTREQARYGMMEAQGATSDELSAQLGVILGTVNDSILEAQAQLDAAKAAGLPQEDINALAADLYGLREEAANVEKELAGLAEEAADLARVPLEEALRDWATTASGLSALMGLYGNSSQSSALIGALSPALLATQQGSYEANRALMNASTDPDDIASYGQAALGDLSDMFGTQQAVIQSALDDDLKTIDDAQGAWEDAWQDRSDALSDALDAQMARLEQQRQAMSKLHQEELDELTGYYDDKLSAFAEAEQALTREEQRADARAGLTSLQAELRGLYGKAGLSASDWKRIIDVRKRIAEAEKAASRQEAAWGREDAQTALERERDAALAELQAQQEAEETALDQRISAAQAAAEVQRQALEDEREAQLTFYEQQRTDAKKAAQDQIDALVTYYGGLMQAVLNGQAQLLALPTPWDVVAPAGSITAQSVGEATGEVVLGGGVDNGGPATGTTGEDVWADWLAQTNLAQWGNAEGRYSAAYTDSLAKHYADIQTSYFDGQNGWVTKAPIKVDVVVSGDGTTLTDAQLEALERALTENVVAEVGRRQHRAAYMN